MILYNEPFPSQISFEFNQVKITFISDKVKQPQKDHNNDVKYEYSDEVEQKKQTTIEPITTLYLN